MSAKTSYQGDLPFSLEAEQAVLGAILLEPKCLSQVTMILKPDYFYLPQHKSIFASMIALDASQGGKIDPLLVLDALKNENLYDDESGKSYLFQLSKLVPSSANVESYAKIIREKFYIRSLIVTTSQINDSALNEEMPADALLDMAEQKIYDIRQGKTVSGPSHIGDVLKDVYVNLYKLSSDDRAEYAGFPTGFSDLDKMITGLNRSDLVLIGARPAMGKTSFALNMARNVAVYGKKKVLFFSLEMPKEQLASRILSTEARVQSTKFRTGNLTPKEWEQIANASVFLSKAPIYFDDTSTITTTEMKARVRQLKDVDVVFIDYLQLMNGTKNTDNRVQEVSEITRNLKLMAKDLKIPVVCLSQLARRTEEKGRSHRPQLSDLRESGSIEQDADIVLMLYREDYYNTEYKNATVDEIRVDTAEVLVQKNRHGPTGSVPLAWNPDFTMFTSRERNIDEE